MRNRDSGINIQSLIDEVLGIYKSRQNKPSWYGGNKDEEDYWKWKRGQNAATETANQTFGHQTQLQEQKIGGELGVEKEKSAGALARQEMVNKGWADTAKIEGPFRVESQQGRKKTPGESAFDDYAKQNALVKTPEEIASVYPVFNRLDKKNQPSGSDRGDFYKDTTVNPSSPASSPTLGGKSMEFRTDLGTAGDEKKKKKSEDYLLEGTRPLSRSWL
jgi:hypothetical protein